MRTGLLVLGLGLVYAGSAWAADAVGKIALERSVPAEQASVLKRDRELFRTLRLDERNVTLKSLLGVRSADPETMIGWLEDRVSAVVGESFVTQDHRFVANPRYAYPNPGIYPLHEKQLVVPSRPGVLVMSNIGAAEYERGKRQGALLGLQLDDIGELLISSPRSGVIKIGPGLFQPNHPINAQKAASISNAIPRLGTFFHEARHSDGHGTSLAFLHAICPPEHDLAGNFACDRNLNGPYTIGGTMLQAMTEACKDCSAGEKEALRLRYLDSFGRVIQVSPNGARSTRWDPAPEGARL